jgi:hypothetical protein
MVKPGGSRSIAIGKMHSLMPISTMQMKKLPRLKILSKMDGKSNLPSTEAFQSTSSSSSYRCMPPSPQARCRCSVPPPMLSSVFPIRAPCNIRLLTVKQMDLVSSIVILITSRLVVKSNI